MFWIIIVCVGCIYFQCKFFILMNMFRVIGYVKVIFYIQVRVCLLYFLCKFVSLDVKIILVLCVVDEIGYCYWVFYYSWQFFVFLNIFLIMGCGFMNFFFFVQCVEFSQLFFGVGFNVVMGFCVFGVVFMSFVVVSMEYLGICFSNQIIVLVVKVYMIDLLKCLFGKFCLMFY